MFPTATSAVQPSNIYSDRTRNQMANLAGAESRQNLDYFRSKNVRPGMSRLGGIGQLAQAPWMKSMFDAAANRQGSLLQTASANAQHKLQGQQARWGGAMGYMSPQLSMYGSDIQNRGSDLANMNALTQLLFGLA